MGVRCGGRETYAKDHSEAFHTTHVCRFEIALHRVRVSTSGREAEQSQGTHHANEVSIPHLLNRNIIHQTGDDSPRTRFLAEVDFLSHVSWSVFSAWRAHRDLLQRRDYQRRGAWKFRRSFRPASQSSTVEVRRRLQQQLVSVAIRLSSSPFLRLPQQRASCHPSPSSLSSVQSCLGQQWLFP